MNMFAFYIKSLSKSILQNHRAFYDDTIAFLLIHTHMAYMLNGYNKLHKEKLKLIVHLCSVEFYDPHKQ